MSSLSLSRRMKLKALAVLSLFTLVVMLFVSNDSPLASINNHVDSAIFFMSGKAWANGLIPYVDFSDSKGPLLWFIEMVGYWISPTDYHGVWVLSVLVMSLTFYVCWLTAMAVLHRPRLSMCVAMTMAIPYFLGFSFLETRAETWCNLPVIYGIYLVVRLIRQHHDGKIVSLTVWEAAWFGAAVMSCMLIKWSIAAMMMSLCLAVLLLSWKSGMRFVKSLGAFVAGATAIALPFAAYLACIGAFASFIQEYFMATASTVGVGDASQLIGFYINEARKIYHSPISVLSIMLSLPGAYMLFRRYGIARWILLLCYCVFFLIGSYGNHWLYYLQVSLSFALLGLIWIADRLNGLDDVSMKKSVFYGLCVGLTVVYLHSLYPVYHPGFDDTDYANGDKIIALNHHKKEHPTILCYRTLDVGVGISSEILPVSRYWFHQNGAAEDMKLHQDSILRSGQADFIYANDADGCFSIIENTGLYTCIWKSPQRTGQLTLGIWKKKTTE